LTEEITVSQGGAVDDVRFDRDAQTANAMRQYLQTLFARLPDHARA
jgi:hypothetical protein